MCVELLSLLYTHKFVNSDFENEMSNEKIK